jgi:hypothetical protein
MNSFPAVEDQAAALPEPHSANQTLTDAIGSQDFFDPRTATRPDKPGVLNC